MSHDIEAAKSGRATCATCGEKIAKGATRVAELYQDTNVGRHQYEERYRGDGDYYRVRSDSREPIQRFHHLACAVEKHPSVVSTALKRPFDPELIPDRAALEKQLAAAVEEERKARVAAATAKLGQPQEAAAADPNLDPLLEQLLDAPEDPELVGIVGDLFQSRSGGNDPRGELIVLQMAMRNAKRERGPEVANPRGRTRTAEVEDPTQRNHVQRRDELMAHLTPRLDSNDRSIWGLGFIRRIELGPKSSYAIGELAGLWSHLSVRVLSEVRIELPTVADDDATMEHLAQVLPKSLRRLEIGGSPSRPGSLAKLAAALPRLETLVLIGRRADPQLAHPKLSRIELHTGAPGDSLALLSPELLPAMREIRLLGWNDFRNPFGAFANSRWVGVVDRFHLDEPVRYHTGNPPHTLSVEDVEVLRGALRGRKLPVLEISNLAVSLAARQALAMICDQLICPAAKVVLDDATTHVTHANKPEWGLGKIVKRADGKLEVKFPEHGVKVFKADAPFLVPATDD
jgi:hypothetical protein